MSGTSHNPADAAAHIGALGQGNCFREENGKATTLGDAAQQAWPLVSALPPLAPFVSVPQVARAHLGVTCTNWTLAPLAEDGELVVSELATNAVNASMGPDGNPRYIDGWRMPVVTLRLLSDGVQLLAEVHDQAPGRPVLTGADGDAVSGRGLGIVDALSVRWGWHPVPGGKCCWALLRKDG